MAAAQFYVPAAGWTRIQPGRLGLADLWGGSVREHNREGTIPSVEFYIGQNPSRVDSYVAVNGDTGDLFSFVVFGRRL